MDINSGLGNLTNGLSNISKQNSIQTSNTNSSLLDILNQNNSQDTNQNSINQSNNNQANGTIMGLGSLSFNNQMNKSLDNYTILNSPKLI